MAFLTFNKDNSNLCYAISYTPLAGTEILAHFHGPAMKGDVAGPGVASPVLHNITLGTPPGPSPVGSPKQGCVVVSDKQQQKDLKNGLWYINVHTTGPPPASTTGEIRGQVLPLKIKYKNVPAIATSTTTPNDLHDHDHDGFAERRVRRLSLPRAIRKEEQPASQSAPGFNPRATPPARAR